MTRGLDALRQDASETCGARGLWLAGFRFDNGAGSAMLDFVVDSPDTRGMVCAEDLHAIGLALREKGWETTIGGDNAGITRVCVTVAEVRR